MQPTQDMLLCWNWCGHLLFWFWCWWRWRHRRQCWLCCASCWLRLEAVKNYTQVRAVMGPNCQSQIHLELLGKGRATMKMFSSTTTITITITIIITSNNIKLIVFLLPALLRTRTSTLGMKSGSKWSDRCLPSWKSDCKHKGGERPQSLYISFVSSPESKVNDN